jgi:hypothetical protein
MTEHTRWRAQGFNIGFNISLLKTKIILSKIQPEKQKKKFRKLVSKNNKIAQPSCCIPKTIDYRIHNFSNFELQFFFYNVFHFECLVNLKISYSEN